MLFLLVILLPIVGGALLPLLRLRNEKARLLYTEGIILLTSVLTFVILFTYDNTHYEVLTLMKGLTLCFAADGPARIFAGLIAVLWPMANLYAIEYMRHEEHHTVFFAFYTASLGISLAVAFSGSLFSLYVFYECLTVITLPLVIHKQDPASVRAGRKYLTFSITGAAMAFMALCALIWKNGSTDFTWGGVVGTVEGNQVRFLRLMFLLAFIGFGTKAAVFPMYAWLPAASAAPTPVTALLHAVAVVNTGVFAVMRAIYYSFGTALLKDLPVQYIVLLLSSFTVVFASAMAVKEQHLKRRLAYSTVSNLSYMLIGLSLMSPEGLTGAFAHMLTHGMMKITLFFCAGAILVKTGLEYVQDVRGLHKRMPVTCAVYLLAAVAMVGIPPLCGFVSKWQLVTAAVGTGHWTGTVAAVSLLISSVLTAVYLLSPAFSMYFRPAEGKNAGIETRCDPTWRMLVPFYLLCVMMLLFGLFSSAPISLITSLIG